MEEARPARRLLLKFSLLAGALGLIAFLGYRSSRPPRLAWGSVFIHPSVPRNCKAIQVYGADWVEDLKLRVSGSTIVFIPVRPHPEAGSGWPRLTGRTRPIAPNQSGEEEIQFLPP